MSTKKYITLDQALEVLDCQACYWAADYMELIPAANVRENVKGQWLYTRIGSPYSEIFCSVCGYIPERHAHKFCPNCGADMREEEE